MSQNVKIYKENYENLPGRFIEKNSWILRDDTDDIKRIMP